MRILVYIFFFMAVFPYLDFFQLGTDTQPNALIFACIVLFAVRNKKLTPAIILLYVQFLISLSLIFMNTLGTYGLLRILMNYLSPPLLASATYTIYSQLKLKLPFGLFVFAVVVYGIVGLVQLYWYPDFMGFLLNANRGSLLGGRGVLSLCPEPTFYGSTCLFFMIFSFLNYTKKQSKYIIPVILAQFIFLSRSSTAIVIFLLACLLFAAIQLLRFKFRYVFFIGLFLAIAIPVGNQQLKKLEETRAGEIALHFIENPLNITKIDGSIGVRFTSSIAPFLNFKYNGFKPKGVGNYQSFLWKLYRSGECQSFLTIPIIENKDRLDGAINMVLFQLGFLGLLLPIAIYLAFRPLLSSELGLFCFLLFVTLLFTQIKLTHSMIGVIIGLAIHKSNLLRKSSPQV